MDTQIVQVVEGKVKNAVAAVEDISIKNDEDLQKAAVVMTNVKKLSKWITGEKEKIVKPMREAMSAARAIFAPLEEGISGAERKLDAAMVGYKIKKDAEQKKKEESIAKRVDSGQLKEETGVRKLEELGEVKNNLQTETGAVAFKKVKTMRVIDESKIPDIYWIIDMTTLRSAALNEAKIQGKLGELIPGCEVYEKIGTATSV